MKRIFFISALFLLASAATNANASSFKVVVNSGVRIQSMAPADVSAMFMKRTGKWENGVAVVPVDQSERTGVRDDFSRLIHRKSAAAVKSYWNQMIFTGREIPPIEKDGDADVVAFVRATPGAIGYVSESAATDGVRVIEVQ